MLTQQFTTSVLPVGSPFPDGELLGVHGDPTSLRSVLAGRAGVVIFYRGAWCPHCNLALRTYQQQLRSPLAALGMAMVAISPQRPDGSLTMQEVNELEFDVVSDPGNQIARALGILTALSDETITMQLGRGLDVAATNADGTTEVPMPTVALVDRHGALAWLDVQRDHTVRTAPDLILEAVQATLGDSA